MGTIRQRVAVIGAGPGGLAVTKSLLEEGFDVTAFDDRHEVGGLWTYTDDPTITSVTTTTRIQVSKFLTPFSDFPHKDDFPLHPSATAMSKYYRDYAKHFGLRERIQLSRRVRLLERREASNQWLLYFEETELPEAFDKVVVASGGEHDPCYPVIQDVEKFQGVYVHGKEYKRPDEFRGKRVVVIGQGNSAADCAVELSEVASRVYIAHRRGSMIVPRAIDGVRVDKSTIWKLQRLYYWLSAVSPWLGRWLAHLGLRGLHRQAWGKLDPTWKLDPSPYCASSIPGVMVSDHLIPSLRAGTIISVPGVRRVVGPKSLGMDDGSIIEDVDAVIACTGYRANFGLLGQTITYDENKRPQLYHNMFPIDYADSLACLHYTVVKENAATCREIAGMAIAQIWAGKSQLPDRETMLEQIDFHKTWFQLRAKESPISQPPGLVEPHSFFRFINEMAGTGIYEHFGWTWQGVWFFLWQPGLYFRMAWGIHSPHIYRYFKTGKRKAWDGARAAIDHAHEMSQMDLREAGRINTLMI